ncbi:MAG: cupin domain-containing protein [Candidatus Buchananbacteria bacterium]|nr:cupin domain-containing protein [Candidatus Buchananbacteria bacterium]
MSYQENIIDKTQQNEYFRQVLFTGSKSQLVVMSIKSGEDIGQETHNHVEQVLFFLSGVGKAILDGEESEVKAGDVVVVTPGTEHNFVNTGSEPLKIYTIYCPPNHIEGRVHKTKEEAEADTEDEDFGHSVE